MRADRYKSTELVFNSDVDTSNKNDRCDKLLRQSIISRNMINDDLVLFEKEKSTLNYDRPIAIGCAVLDISKFLMSNFYYNVFKKHFDCGQLYGDTDSTMIEVKTENFAKDLLDKGISHYFDFSNVDESLLKDSNSIFHKLIEQEEKDIKTLVSDGRKGMTYKEMVEFCEIENITEVILNGKIYSSIHELKDIIESGDYNFKKERKQNGAMKEECDWLEISEVICLQSKSYSVKVKGKPLDKNKKTAKGVKRSLHKELNHCFYKFIIGETLNEEEEEFFNTQKSFTEENLNFKFDDELKTIKGNQKGIQSKDRQLYTLEMSKILLNNFNDKRYDDNYAYGHCRTKSN